MDIHWYITKNRKDTTLPNSLIYSLSTRSEKQNSLTSVNATPKRKSVQQLLVALSTWCSDLFPIILECATAARAGVTIRQTRRLPRALGQRGCQKRTKKYDYVVQKMTNVHQAKNMMSVKWRLTFMNMINVNEIHLHAVYEKIEVWHYFHYFRYAARRVNIFPNYFNFTYR